MGEDVQAVDALQQLGLSEYESRCLVALLQLPNATAKDVSQISDVPRSRVYDAMDRLHRRGIVDVHNGDPKRFQSVEVDSVLQILRDQYDAYFDTVEESLKEVEPEYKQIDRAIWAIETHENVTDRTLKLVEEATDELVVAVCSEQVVDEELIERLRAASDRGVSVVVGTCDESVRDTLDSELPDAHTFDSAFVRGICGADGATVGRVVMADRSAVLVSTVIGERLPGVPDEKAVWSNGYDHGFGVFVRQVLVGVLGGAQS
jgi:sugar-specific transcriptional regulator TrmB